MIEPLMNELLCDVRFACRQLVRRRGFSATAILTLAVGIGANTAMFGILNGMLLKPLPYPDQDRLLYLSAFPGLGRRTR